MDGEGEGEGEGTSRKRPRQYEEEEFGGQRGTRGRQTYTEEGIVPTVDGDDIENAGGSRIRGRRPEESGDGVSETPVMIAPRGYKRRQAPQDHAWKNPVSRRECLCA